MDKEKEGSEHEDSRSPVEVKKEPVENEDIKDYAANTMNELLAIYGYDEKVDKSVTEDLHLQDFSDKKQSKKRKEGKRKSSGPSPTEVGEPSEDCASTSGSSTGSGSSGNDLEVAQTRLYSAIRSAGEIDERRGSYEQQIICAWCQQVGVKRYTLNTATESKAFCSEKCFAACRRAYFKRNKVCDWCRHIRHTKEYVEFQNGDAKQQFCSVKCLNQYKMDIFCKETQSLGTNREYKVDPVPGCELPSTATTPTAADSEEGISKKSKRPSGLTTSGEARSVAESSSGTCTPLALTTGARNGTVRQIQTMLQNRSTSRIQAQADSTVSSSNGLPIQGTTPGMTSAPPQAAINAAASVQAAAALQQSTFLGVPAVFQSPLGASHSQILGQTPLIVNGNQIPVIPHQPGNVVLQPSQIGAPAQIINSPTLPTSPPPLQGMPRTQPLSNSTKLPSPQPHQPSAPSAPSSVLPPVTIIVPHPIFVPIPIPVPVPIPIRAEVYDAIKNAAAAGTAAADAAARKECATEEADEDGDMEINRSSLHDSEEGRSQSLMNLASIDTGKESSSQGILHNRVRILKGLQKPSSSQKSSPNLLFSPFPASNGLHRSASLDLGLASHPSRGKSSTHSHGRKVKAQVVMVGEDTTTPHDGRESSRKVREVLRVHLNKRISQSALNLAELGLMSTTEGGPLRRSHSLSRLRESSINPENSLGGVGPRQVSSLSVPYNKGPTRKPRRVLDNCNRIEEDAETERKLMIHEEELSNSGTEDEPEEPSCKRRKWTMNGDNV